MVPVRYVHWQDEGFRLGYLEEYPDYLTQGQTLEELQESLRGLYRDLNSVKSPGFAKSPCVRKVLGSERWVGLKQLLLTGSEPPRLLQQPYRNSGAGDARISAADAGVRIDAGKVVAEVLDHPLQKLRLLPA
jgi:hypothetical protein